MSATGRSEASGTGYVRHADDDFATPHWTTRAILPHLKCGTGDPLVLDPCCGKGAILDVAKAAGMQTVGIELSPERAAKANHTHAVARGDALTMDRWPECNLIVTNPPYVLAMPFIEKALIHGGPRSSVVAPFVIPTPIIDIAFLLRINFLGSQKRAEFHKKHPCDLFVLPRRPEFVMSVSCKRKCGWGMTIPFDDDGKPVEPKPRACPTCGMPTTSSKSDATEYAWFVWGPGRGNRWFLLSDKDAG